MKSTQFKEIYEPSLNITKKDGIFTISDDGDVNQYTIDFEESELSIKNPNADYLRDTGRLTDEKPITFLFKTYLENFTENRKIALINIINWSNPKWISTHPTFGINSLTVRYTIDGSALGIADKTIRFNYCDLEASFSRGDSGVLSISGLSYQANYYLE